MRIYDRYGDPFDYCRDCFPDESEALERHGPDIEPEPGSGGYGYKSDHPPYEDEFPPYICEECGCNLTSEDD